MHAYYIYVILLMDTLDQDCVLLRVCFCLDIVIITCPDITVLVDWALNTKLFTVSVMLTYALTALYTLRELNLTVCRLS